ncbi:MAG: nucleotide exchange factor GrpE [Ruminococcaceae bacterium]|nr:nucleotide exchange factor GrpE [Oscillospiraceae bacterium]
MSRKNKSPDENNPVPENEDIICENENNTAEEKSELNETEIKIEKESDKKQSGKKKADAPSAESLLKAEKDKYLRMLAEYDNYRKRSTKERESIYSDVKADTVLRFLPVYDNLLRALDTPTEDEAYRRGVEMIMTQFDEILAKMGVTPIECVGKTFDPELHDAVMHETDEDKAENEIVLELQKGFKMGDKVIRFACVKVAN